MTLDSESPTVTTATTVGTVGTVPVPSSVPKLDYAGFLAFLSGQVPVQPEEIQSFSPEEITHRKILNEIGLIVLGEWESTSIAVLYSKRYKKTREFKDIDRIKFESLVQLLGPEIKEQIWRGNPNDKPPEVPYLLRDIKEAIASEAGRHQLSRKDSMGCGVWSINDRLVLIGQHELATVNGSMDRSEDPLVNGKLIEFDGDQWYAFDHLSNLFQQAKSPTYRQQTMTELIELFSRWDNWENDHNAELAAALVCCTWLQTVWDWRPMVYVTGPTSCGKTMLLNECLGPLFGSLALCLQKSSEAGIRQVVGQSAQIVILDEFESDHNRRQIQMVVRTSGRGSKVARGTNSGQKGVLFGYRHMFWMGSIETGLRDGADLNRYIILKLRGLSEKKRKHALHLPSRQDLAELGMRSLACVMTIWEQVRRLADVLYRRGCPDVDRRIVESYALPAAMLACMNSLSDDAAYELMVLILTGADFIDQQQGDEQTLLEAIFDAIVFSGPGKQSSIRQLLSQNCFDVDAQAVLERNGIRRVSGRTGQTLFFKSGELIASQLLKNTSHKDKKISEILLRVKGATYGAAKFSGRAVRGVHIPIDSLNALLNAPGGLLLDDDTQDDGSVAQGTQDASGEAWELGDQF